MKIWVVQSTCPDELSDLNSREVLDEILAAPTLHDSKLGAIMWIQEFVAEAVKEYNEDQDREAAGYISSTLPDCNPEWQKLEVPEVKLDDDYRFWFEELDLLFQVNELELQGS